MFMLLPYFAHLQPCIGCRERVPPRAAREGSSKLRCTQSSMVLHLATTAAISWSLGAPTPLAGGTPTMFKLPPAVKHAAVAFTTTAMPMAAVAYYTYTGSHTVPNSHCNCALFSLW